MPALSLDLSGNESAKTGSIPRRGRLEIRYDLRVSAGRQGLSSPDEVPGTFEIRGLYDSLPWNSNAYPSPRFLIEDLNDLQMLLLELQIIAGRQQGISFERRLEIGHYGSTLRQKSFIPDALAELNLTGDSRALEMLRVCLAQVQGDVRRAWPLFKSMIKAANVTSASS